MIYYSLNRRVHGPVTVPELHQLYTSGTISDRTLVMRAGTRKWTPYHVEFRASAPPPPLLPLAPAGAGRAGEFTVSPSFYSAPVRPGRTLILAGWILMACTVGLAFVPLFGFATWLLAGGVVFITIVFAAIALAQGAAPRQGVALLLGTFFLFPVVVFLVPILSTATVGALANAFSRDTPPQRTAAPRIQAAFQIPSLAPAVGFSSVSSAPAHTTAPYRPASPAAQTGTPVHLPDSTWEVLHAATADRLPEAGVITRAPGSTHQYITVSFRVTNTRRESAPVAETPQLIDSAGRRYAQMPATGYYLPQGAQSIALKTLRAGETRTFTAIYEVPRTAHSFAFEARPLSLLPDRATIRLGL